MRKKESKGLAIIKKGFKKNEIIIYSIALMLVTAGYFNYTANLNNNTIETTSDETLSVADLNNNNDLRKEEQNISNNNENKSDNTVNKREDEDIGDAKLVNSNSVDNEPKTETDGDSSNEEDYFVKTKLERDTNYADLISTYTKILEDKSISETQKGIAMKEITKINDNKNAISICENLLLTKGFKDYVILVNNDSINVVVKVEGELEKNQVAQIQNIVSREFKSEIENIHITER